VGSGSPSAKVPKEDQDGVDMMPQDDTPAEGRDLGSAAGLNAPDRAGEAQVVRDDQPPEALVRGSSANSTQSTSPSTNSGRRHRGRPQNS
jgi:hypothetical protein